MPHTIPGVPAAVKWVIDRCHPFDDLDDCFVWKQCVSTRGRPMASKGGTGYFNPQAAVYGAMVKPHFAMQLRLIVDFAGIVDGDRLFVRPPKLSRQAHVIRKLGGGHCPTRGSWFIPLHSDPPPAIADLVAERKAAPTLDVQGTAFRRNIRLLCGEPRCCNWKHMVDEPHQTTMRRAAAEGKLLSGDAARASATKSNRQHPNCILTKDKAEEIHARIRDGQSLKDVAQAMGLKYAHVWDVSAGRLWQDAHPNKWIPLGQRPLDRKRQRAYRY